MIQTQALQDRNVSDKQQWESAVKFMENSVRKELEREESELIANTSQQSSWKKYVGLQRATIEERNRKQCVKELDKVLVGRKELDQSTKHNQTVRICLNK